MGRLQVVDVREKEIGREGGRGGGCPYCGGPLLAMDFDTQLVVFCIPFSHKTKRKLFCTICSRRLLIPSSF
ncbi:NUT family member protein [Actinidia chinensis var. chinensis]|uniref:NUT family member protein n=1 Tax=Actinidia chinensis var. chinensis TaxID=1590841 RepID=A0A2R6PV54_ACTCC|nr:NUT family member protein [Actinidia chinensis var. chinensis]